MQNRIHIWNTTLSHFLELSNENQIIHNLFAQRVFPEIVRRFESRKINWLEIGPGNGDKLIECINSFKGHSPFNLSICEPDFAWIPSLEIKIGSAHRSITTCYYVSNIQEIGLNEIKEFDFISMVHVLYDKDLKEHMKYLIQNTPNALYWIQAESPSSDFHKIRKLMRREGIFTVRSQIDNLENDLIKLGITHLSIETHEKVFHINPEDLVVGLDEWFSAFLIGCNQSDFISYPNHIKKKIKAIVSDYISSYRPDGVMKIDDRALII